MANMSSDEIGDRADVSYGNADRSGMLVEVDVVSAQSSQAMPQVHSLGSHVEPNPDPFGRGPPNFTAMKKSFRRSSIARRMSISLCPYQKSPVSSR
jgi:hypothetical protein